MRQKATKGDKRRHRQNRFRATVICLHFCAPAMVRTTVGGLNAIQNLRGEPRRSELRNIENRVSLRVTLRLAGCGLERGLEQLSL